MVDSATHVGQMNLSMIGACSNILIWTLIRRRLQNLKN